MIYSDIKLNLANYFSQEQLNTIKVQRWLETIANTAHTSLAASRQIAIIKYAAELKKIDTSNLDLQQAQVIQKRLNVMLGLIQEPELRMALKSPADEIYPSLLKKFFKQAQIVMHNCDKCIAKGNVKSIVAGKYRDTIIGTVAHDLFSMLEDNGIFSKAKLTVYDYKLISLLANLNNTKALDTKSDAVIVHEYETLKTAKTEIESAKKMIVIYDANRMSSVLNRLIRPKVSASLAGYLDKLAKPIDKRIEHIVKPSSKYSYEDFQADFEGKVAEKLSKQDFSLMMHDDLFKFVVQNYSFLGDLAKIKDPKVAKAKMQIMAQDFLEIRGQGLIINPKRSPLVKEFLKQYSQIVKDQFASVAVEPINLDKITKQDDPFMQIGLSMLNEINEYLQDKQLLPKTHVQRSKMQLMQNLGQKTKKILLAYQDNKLPVEIAKRELHANLQQTKVFLKMAKLHNLQSITTRYVNKNTKTKAINIVESYQRITSKHAAKEKRAFRERL